MLCEFSTQAFSRFQLMAKNTPCSATRIIWALLLPSMWPCHRWPRMSVVSASISPALLGLRSSSPQRCNVWNAGMPSPLPASTVDKSARILRLT